MTPSELRKRIAVLEAKAPAEPIGDPEWAAQVEAMTDAELDFELNRRLAEYHATPEGQELARRIEALTDAELDALLRWECANPATRGPEPWPAR